MSPVSFDNLIAPSVDSGYSREIGGDTATMSTGKTRQLFVQAESFAKTNSVAMMWGNKAYIYIIPKRLAFNIPSSWHT